MKLIQNKTKNCFTDEELINIYFRFRLVSLHFFSDNMMYQLKEKKINKKSKE